MLTKHCDESSKTNVKRAFDREADSGVSKNLTEWTSMAEPILKNIVLLTKRVNHEEHVSTLFKLFL